MSKTAVHLIETLHCGGTENIMLRLLPKLENNGWNNTVITLRGGGEMVQEFRQNDINVIELNQANFLSPRTITTLKNELARIRPDIIITNLLRSDILGRLILPFFTQAPIVSHLGTTYNHRRYWPARLFERLTGRLARSYIANSVAVKEFYIQRLGVSASKIQTVQTGIDLEAFNAISKNTARRDLGLPAEALVVSCVGSLVANKGQQFLLKAFEDSFSRRADAYLLIVGEGEDEGSLLDLKKTLGSENRIIFLGKRRDIASILAASDIFVLPTLFEGLSVALLEAMAAKLAIITTDIPENRIILTDQKSALLVQPSSADTITQALTDLAKDPHLRRSLGDEAYKFVSRGYSMSAQAANFAKALHKICSQKI